MKILRVEGAAGLHIVPSLAPADALRDLISSEREKGRAFGPVAEAARHELARRGEQA